MPVVADAAVAIRGDLSRFGSDLKKAETQTQSLGKKLDAALNPRNLVGGLAGGFAALQVVGFLGDAVQAASHMNETLSKTNVILGEEALPGLEKWAEAAAEAFGQSKQQALDAASTFAIFGKSAGLAGQDLVSFSTELTELSSDFASFFDTSPEEAIVAIGAALRGESEPIRRYGVLLDDATLRQRAFKLGLIQTTSQALLPQQRVLAAQAEILAQTSDAQGDFARTGEGLANTQRKLQAKLDNLVVTLGERLLPVVLEVTTALDDLVTEIGDGEPVWDAFGVVVEGIASQIKVFMGPIDLLRSEYERLAEGVGVAGNVLDAEARRWAGNTRSFADNLTAAEPGMRQAAQYVFGATADAVIEARQKAAAEAREIPGAISQALIQGLSDIEDGLDAVRDLMENSLSDAAKVARLNGILASSELAAGLLDERADVRGSWMQIRDDATEELQLLESGAYDAAVDTGTTIAEQLRLQENVIRQGMVDALRGARNVLADGWATPAVPAPRLLGGPMESPSVPGGGGNTVNNNLTVNGVPYHFDTRDDFISALDNLSAFGDGRMPGGSR